MFGKKKKVKQTKVQKQQAVRNDAMKKIAESRIAKEREAKKEVLSRTTTYKVAGITFHVQDILQFFTKDTNYSLSKAQLIQKRLVDTMIYEYHDNIIPCELVLNPTNEYDPNAIKVVINDITAGFIPKGSCTKVKKLIESGEIKNIGFRLLPGNYKCVDYDGVDYSYHFDDKNKFASKVYIELKK